MKRIIKDHKYQRIRINTKNKWSVGQIEAVNMPINVKNGSFLKLMSSDNWSDVQKPDYWTFFVLFLLEKWQTLNLLVKVLDYCFSSFSVRRTRLYEKLSASLRSFKWNLKNKRWFILIHLFCDFEDKSSSHGWKNKKQL